MKKSILCLFVCLIFMGCSGAIEDGKTTYAVSSVRKNILNNTPEKKKYVVNLYIEGEWKSLFFDILLYTNEEVLPDDRFELVKVERKEK